MVLITYDVSTTDKKGPSRLNKVAKECLNYGQRVQNSVFECIIDYSHFLILKEKLLKIIDKDCDSIRIYRIGNNWQNKIESYGIKTSYDPTGLLII